MERQFWHMQLHSDRKLTEDRIKRILIEKKVIGMADSWKNKKGGFVKTPTQFRNRMRVGDVVLVRSGRRPIALVQVRSEAFMTKKTVSDLDWFPLRRKVEVLAFFAKETENILQKSLTNYGKKYIQALGTLTVCEKPSATKDFIQSWWNTDSSSVG